MWPQQRRWGDREASTVVIGDVQSEPQMRVHLIVRFLLGNSKELELSDLP